MDIGTSGYPIYLTVSSKILVSRFLLTVVFSDWDVWDVLKDTWAIRTLDLVNCHIPWIWDMNVSGPLHCTMDQVSLFGVRGPFVMSQVPFEYPFFCN
jgi:hypothetical protein